MAIYQVRQLASVRTPDDNQIYVVRRDLSGGINSRQHGSVIGDNQSTVLYNVDLGTAGQSSKRPGSVLIGNDVGNSTVLGLHNFEIQGETDQLLMYEGTSVYKWTGAGNWTALKADFTASTEVGMCSGKESGLAPDDVVIIQNGVDNAFRLDSDGNFQDLGNTAGTASDSPPSSTVMAWYGNRFWVLKNDQLYFSDAYSDDYSDCWDTVSNVFRIPVGEERGIVPTRDTGMIIMGREAIWGLAPSAVPVATDKPEPIVTNRGVVSKNGFVNAGDDIYYFSQDGFRALRRTVQDKLQAGVDYPLSYFLKDEFDRINFAYIERLSIEYFDNKIFIAVPTGATTFDTWVYYPEAKSFTVIQGWTPTCWERYKISGEEYLYYGTISNGKVYKAWSGYTDEGTTTTNGTAINYQEEGRKEDGGQPLVKKCGGVLKIKALSSGNYNLTVYASIDDQAYVTLGTINLTGTAPTLPVNLPFTLASANIITESFPLDSLGEWNQIRIKIVHNAANGSDVITVLEREIISYALAFEDGA
jgi:hypothetical protein